MREGLRNRLVSGVSPLALLPSLTKKDREEAALIEVWTGTDGSIYRSYRVEPSVMGGISYGPYVITRTFPYP